MSDLKLILDLGDGIAPATVEKLDKPKRVSERLPVRFAAPPDKIEITSTPVALVISVAPISCLGCGREHRDHRGLFVEKKLSNGVRALSHTTLREAGPYAALPKRVDLAPREAIPVCADCFEQNLGTAVAVALAEAEVSFGELGASRPVPEIAEDIIAAVQEDRRTTVNSPGEDFPVDHFSIKIDEEDL